MSDPFDHSPSLPHPLDPEQRAARQILTDAISLIKNRKKEDNSFFYRLLNRFFKSNSDPISPFSTDGGIYMFGTGGRGKTMLMDWFFAQLEGAEGDQLSSDNKVRKKRVHFHNFMSDIHHLRHERRDGDSGANGAKGGVAAEIGRTMGRELDCLCFDEFHVTDVADAMILHPLITALIKQNVFIVITSNWRPDNLYQSGLQRQRFIPFIKLLKQRFQIVPLTEGPDYRLDRLEAMPRWLMPLNSKTDNQFEAAFIKLIARESTENKAVPPKTIDLGGSGHKRRSYVTRAGQRTLYLDFSDFIRQPFGADDFSALAKQFDTLFLNGVKAFKNDQNERVKRFMTLIDILYDRDISLFVRAAVAPDHIYRGQHLAFEFERTVSRLFEMAEQ